MLWIEIMFAAAVILSLYYSITKYAWLTANNSIVHIACLGKEEKCEIEFKSGKKVQVKVLDAAWVANYFATLLFKSETKKYKCVISKDAISQEQLYTFRLYLRSVNKSK